RFMAFVTLAELKSDLDLELTDNGDDADLQDILDAAVAFVLRVHPDLDEANVPADIKLGTIRLAGRWFTRRRSPDGLFSMGDLGAARVPSIDTDIERLLKIGRFAPARFA